MRTGEGNKFKGLICRHMDIASTKTPADASTSAMSCPKSTQSKKVEFWRVKPQTGNEPSLVQSIVSTLSTEPSTRSKSGVVSTAVSTTSTLSSGLSSNVSSVSLSTRYSSSNASQVAVFESLPNCRASSLVKPQERRSP